jgi:microcystin-dependent protein
VHWRTNGVGTISGSTASAARPGGAVLARTTANVYNAAPDCSTTMNPGMIANSGGNQPHDNLQPFLVLNFCIALQGIFPAIN